MPTRRKGLWFRSDRCATKLSKITYSPADLGVIMTQVTHVPCKEISWLAMFVTVKSTHVLGQASIQHWSHVSKVIPLQGCLGNSPRVFQASLRDQVSKSSYCSLDVKHTIAKKCSTFAIVFSSLLVSLFSPTSAASA